MNVNIDDITIRTELRPGDIGYITWMHGDIYSRENGFGISFEAYVAKGLYEFYKDYDIELDRVWVAEHGSRIVGFLLLMHRENNAAQLRYFLFDPDYRGIGLGKKLVGLFMDFLKAKGYRSCYLWTTDEQDAAAAIYKKLGFILTDEVESTAFGKPLKEHRYELLLK
ncbi:MAG: GNAT family N-acetyltransferase [Bacteroidota bacterium]